MDDIHLEVSTAGEGEEPRKCLEMTDLSVHEMDDIHLEVNPLNAGKGEEPRKCLEIDGTSAVTSASHIRITFWTHFGMSNLLMVHLCVGVAAINVYIYSQFTWNFTQLQASRERTGVVFFPVLALLCILFPIRWLTAWRSYASGLTEVLRANSKRANVNLIENKRANDAIIQTLVRKLKWLWSAIQPRGKYYLFKLYLSELIESANQMYNLFVVYLCTLPMEISIPLCLCLSVDCFFIARGTCLPHTPRTRERQLKIDTAIDCFTASIPILYLNAIGMTFSVLEVAGLTVVPSIFMLLKMDDIYEESVYRLSMEAVLRDQRKRSSRMRRRRTSLFGMDKHTKTAQMQASIVPPRILQAFMVVKLVLGIFFVVQASIQVVSLIRNSSECGQSLEMDEIWNACKVKVPFCNSPLQPHCECAILDINAHNFTRLPQRLNEMTALRKAAVTRGPLEEISEAFGTMAPNLVHLNFEFNRLTSIPDSFGRMPRLLYLIISYNAIEKLPENIFQSPTLYLLDVSSNKLLGLPAMYMPSLRNLLLANNSLHEVPPSLTTETCPILTILDLSGNLIDRIPETSIAFRETLVHLYLGHNNLTSLPDAISELKILITLDIRNNSLQTLPIWLDNMAVIEKGNYFFASGNPLCTNQWYNSKACPANLRLALLDDVQGCTSQCSDYCNRELEENGFCDAACNVEACTSDGHSYDGCRA